MYKLYNILTFKVFFFVALLFYPTVFFHTAFHILFYI